MGVMKQVARNTYAYLQPEGTWCVNTAGLIIGNDKSLLVDTVGTESRMRALLDEIARIPGADPPSICVNTHAHGDHTFGNYLLPQACEIIGHRATHTEMEQRGLALTQLWPDVEWGDLTVRLPDTLADDAATYNLGNLPVEIFHIAGGAHTDGDLIVWLPVESVLFSGDITMNGVTPFYLFGNAFNALVALDRLAAFSPSIVVSGHGDVGGPEVISLVAEYTRHVICTAEAAARQQIDVKNLVEFSSGNPHSAWAESERHAVNVYSTLVALDPSTYGANIDVNVAFELMKSALGGRDPVSLA